MVRETSPRPKLRPEGFGVSEQTERMLEPEGDPVSPTEVMKTGLTEEVMGKAQDYVDNPPPEPKKDPLAFAAEKGYVKAIKGPEEKERYISNLNVGTEEGNQTVRQMFENILGKNPDWDPLLVNWCATFVSDVLDNLGADPLKTNDKYDRLRARKFVKYGSPVERKNIQQGDIVVLDFPRDSEGNITFGPGGKRDGVGDHVTFYVGDKSSANKDGSGYIGVLGGNQGYSSEIGIAEYPEENILAVRRITYDDVDYEFTEALAKDNPNFKAFLKKEGEGFDFESFANPDPMTGFNEGGLAENDNLELARAYGVTVVDPEETDETLKAFGKAAIESLPGISTAATVRDIKEELEEEDPSWGKIGLLAASEVVGMVPGLGDAAQNMVRQGVKRFKTKKGSTYEVKEGNTTVRDKAARKEHPGESGIQPQSVKTIYMPRSEVEKFAGLHQNPEIGTEFVPTGSNTAALRYTEDYGPNKAGDIVKGTEVEFTLEPEVGLNPVEILDFKNPRGIHFGNEITEVVSDARPVDYAEDLAQAEKLIESDELLKEWRKENGGKGQRFENPAKEDAEDFFQGDITRKELQTLINSKLGDPTLYTLDNFPDMPTVTDTVGGMGTKARKYGILGVKGFDLKEGQRVGSRLDIPAYNEYDKWIVSIHDGNVDKGGVVGYGQAIRLKNIEFKSEPKMALDIARKKELKAADPEKGTPAKYQTKSTIARIHGDYVKEDPYELYEQAKLLLDDPEWTQVGMNPYRGSFFYDKKTGMPVLNAEEVIQVGPLVLAKKVKTPKLSELKKYFGGEFKDGKYKSAARTKDGKVKVFNQGGAVMNEQMEMAFMAEGGLKDDGLSVDPVSGNDIPNGSLAEEVRDDIPAQLSEGEYVVPADVVRFYGVKFFEDLREEAKRGLADMEANGRIGGEPVPAGGPQVNEAPVTEQEMAALRELAMEMNVGGMVPDVNPNMQPPPQAVGNASPQQPQMMNKGGTVLGFQSAGDTGTTNDALSAVQSKPLTGGGLGFSLFGPYTNDGSLPTGFGDDTKTTPFEEGQIVELYKDGKVLSFVMMRDYQAYLDKIEEGWLTKEQKDAKIAEEGPTVAGTDDTTTTDEETTGTTDSSDDRTDYRQFTTQTSTTPPKNVADMTDDELKVALEGMNIVGRTGSTLAYSMGLPVGALVGSQLAANYNNMLEVARDRKLISDKEYEDKRKGSIFGGEKSIFDNLIDRSDKNKSLGTSNKKGVDFGDTWLGDLLGFDGKAGVQGPGLKESFGGARRNQTATAPSSTYAAPTTGATAPGDMGDGLRGSGTTSSTPSTQAEKTSAANAATDDWVAATQAVQSSSSDDPDWGSKIRAQSEASKAATKAIQEASGWSGGFFGTASNPNWRDAAAQGGLMAKKKKKK
jgi:hypothetical protein